MKVPVVLTFVNALVLTVSGLSLRKSLHSRGDQTNGTEDKFIGYRNGQNSSAKLIKLRSRRSAVIDPAHTWPNAAIPYTIDGSIPAKLRSQIDIAMAEIMNKSCIKIGTWKKEKDYVKIFKGNGCYSSHHGRQISGQHDISLGVGCNTTATIIHELMHSIGFYHEQRRSDRDNHINVYLDHIVDAELPQFEKNNEINSDNLGQPYDYHSIMHYQEMDFAKGEHVAMKAKDPKVVVGEKGFLTELDVKKINILYSCSPEFARPCRDESDQCWHWALSGECTSSYRDVMVAKCRLSCKLCESSDTVPPVTKAPTECLDKSPNCLIWARNGICPGPNHGAKWVLDKCPKACKICHV